MNAIVAAETRALSDVLARLGGVPAERILLLPGRPLGEATEEDWLEACKHSLFELVDGVLVEKADMTALVANETRRLSDVLARLGGVPAERILLLPGRPLGEATEEDWERLSGPYELIDGVLVEKTMGWGESWLGMLLLGEILNFVLRHKLGVVLGEQGPARIEGHVRLPDIAFYPWDRIPSLDAPREAILPATPDLAVEVLSPSNTASEMERKRRECFAAGTRLVWEVEPELRVVRVYTDADPFTVLTLSDELTGDPVLPGFRLSLRELFERAEGRPNP